MSREAITSCHLVLLIDSMLFFLSSGLERN